MVRLRPRPAHAGAPAPAIPLRVHLVGAGGMHLSAIGQILLARGHRVTGSDLVESDFTARLRRAGATIHHGHDARHLEGPDGSLAELVVTTVAAPADNPEIAAARARGIPVWVRAEMVQRLLDGHDVLAVAGSHGKTTTTALLAAMTLRGGLDPLVLLGGDCAELGGNARAGDGPAVVEADEYAEAFLHYDPQVALITSIEADHLDYYGTEERLREAFGAFARRLRPGGTLLVCADSPAAAAVGDALASTHRVERYAIGRTPRGERPADWQARDLRRNDHGGMDCRVAWNGAELGTLQLRVPGRHNVQNALGALAVAMRAGVDFHSAQQAAAEFRGVARRFQLVGEAGGVTVVDDYAHHPTEVRATLAAARQHYPGRRLVVCFQPHTYSRSRYLLEEWRGCFAGADLLFVAGTYAAREPAEAGLDARALAAEITEPAATYVDTTAAAVEQIAAAVHPGDLVFTMGAGDIDALGPLLLDALGGAR